MVFVNYLANALPINGIRTGEVSDKYSNLFTPAGIAFSIWGLVYLLLGIYSIYQFKTNNFKKINILFSLTSVSNILWVIAWHYDLIFVSVLIMLILLVLLIKIADVINKVDLTAKEKFIVRLPFSIYFGWITVATIANITVFLVSINWDGFGLSPELWTSIILIVGALISVLRSWYDKNIPYVLVPVWAYFFIFTKHISSDGYAGQYPLIIFTSAICVLFIILFIFYSLIIPKVFFGISGLLKNKISLLEKELDNRNGKI